MQQGMKERQGHGEAHRTDMETDTTQKRQAHVHILKKWLELALTFQPY